MLIAKTLLVATVPILAMDPKHPKFWFVPRASSAVLNGRDVRLNTHVLLIPGLRMRGAWPTPTYSDMRLHGVLFAYRHITVHTLDHSSH
jgi:hypothetical protein